MATHTVLRTKLRVRIGNPVVASVPNSELTENLNDAYRDIATKFRHHKARKLCEFTTVADTAEYALPTDAGAVLRAWDVSNDKKLDVRGAQGHTFVTSPVSAKPTKVVRIRNYIILDPPPDDAYLIRLWYRENITDLANDGDVPVTPSTWDTGLLILAKWYHFQGRGDIPKATTALREYEIWIKDRPTEIEEEMGYRDSGVELPELTVGADRRLDFDESP